MKGGDGNGEAIPRKVVHESDYLHARLRGFKRRVARALDAIEEAAQIGQIGVSFSGGKDSTVMLDLVRRVVPDVPVAFFDSGCELKQTYEMVAHYGADVIQPEKSLLEMCRYGGYWGYRTPEDPDATFNFGEILIDEPARRFCKQRNLDVQAIGLRAEESNTRGINAAQRGELYYAKYSSKWHLCPLQWWTTDDVWAYIASRELAYNSAYDIMERIGVPRKEQRISTLLGSDAARSGRYVLLKQIDIELWNRLSGEFPKLTAYT